MYNGTIILATGNAGKAREIAEILAERGGAAAGLRVVTLKDVIGYMPEIDENGTTLSENARIKTAAAFKILTERRGDLMDRDVFVVADDSGLFVDCLGGRPGVHSARYGAVGENGRPPAPAVQIGLLLDEVRASGAVRPAARFICVMAVKYACGAESLAEGVCEGDIAPEPRGENGFGYDPAFYLPDLGITMAELPDAEKNKISHRGAAVRLLAIEIEKYMERI